MSKLTWVTASLLVGGIAYAEGQAEIALKLNEEGKEAMFANNFVLASAKFRDAVARAPEPKYFFNLCTSLFQEGKFDESLTACNAVNQNNPSAAQRDKVEKLTAKIKEEAKSQGLELHAAGGGGGDTNVVDAPPPDPNNPNPVTNPTPNPNPQPAFAPAVGRPPTQGLFVGTKPDNNYTWTLGVDAFGGGGAIGQSGAYGTAMAGLRVKGDYLINAPSRIGAQGYLQVSHFGKGNTDSFAVSTLDLIDLGIAGYKHICLTGADYICITPLLGAHITMLSPQGETTTADDGSTQKLFNYVSAGVRAEVNLAIAFGTRQEHVLNIALGANGYTKVFSGPAGDMDGASYALDKGGSVGYLGVGYTYRFNTPFGSSPFVTLE